MKTSLCGTLYMWHVAVRSLLDRKAGRSRDEDRDVRSGVLHVEASLVCALHTSLLRPAQSRVEHQISWLMRQRYSTIIFN